jgi:alkylation response protein AidB-like acyl-CoA dehydrogenase
MAEKTPLDVAEEFTPLIINHRSEAEALFRMSPAVFDALGPTGIFRLMAPDRGDELTLPMLVRTIEQLGFADPSVAWAAVNSNLASMRLGKLSKENAGAYLDQKNWFFATGLAPTGVVNFEEGVPVMSGRWPVVSGCEIASFIFLNCRIQDNGEPRMADGSPAVAFTVVPASLVTVHPTWRDSTAIRGSGSHSVSIDRVELPGLHLLAASDPFVQPTIFEHIPNVTFHSLLLAALALGIGRAALEGAIGQAGQRLSAATGAKWIDYPSVQNTISSAEMAVLTARAGYTEVTSQYWTEVQHRDVSLRTRARIQSLVDHVFRVMRSTVSDLFTTGSVDAVRSGHILEQSLRDIHGFGVQWEKYRRLQFEAGRVLMGAEPTDPLF